MHQSARGGASVKLVTQLIGMFAFRTFLNAHRERPGDVAKRCGHRHLFGVLAPECHHQVPSGVLLRIQTHFHKVIRGRIEEPLSDNGRRLPELSPLFELERPHMWFPVPGMYGGFSYWLESTGAVASLVSESWSRVEGGSGQRHEITTAGSRLVGEGFA